MLVCDSSQKLKILGFSRTVLIKELYNSDKVLTPSVEDVFDVKTTREKWVVSDVKMRCIGVIRVKITRRHRIEWRWLKR